ncbi:hypothetical protein [Scytonema sp. UIC 10036]|uniref:DUF7219 family protein n=1 Tax=Scytonema sp. UIC 10036 TaxID=2304196 RepID=UPI001FA9D3EA|nr:hypothetical protein [Scytonema sp. UIC 10036]
METSKPLDKSSFIYPRARYYGQIKPENLAFNANLQEFSHKVSIITCLEISGKLTPMQAYNQIESLSILQGLSNFCRLGFTRGKTQQMLVNVGFRSSTQPT